MKRNPKAWSIRVVAWLTALMGIVNVLSVTTPALSDRLAILRQYLPLEVRFGSHLTATLSGFALILLARHLWRRKRVAWLLTILILVVSAISHLLKGLDYEEALLSSGLALWLICLQSSFHAHSDKPSVRHALWVFSVALTFTLAYGVLGLWLLDRPFSVHFDLMQATMQTIAMFAQFSDTGPTPVTRFGQYFSDSIYIVGAATIGYSLVMLVRPVLVRNPANTADRERAKAIVEAYGHTSLAWFTLFEDKSYYFSPGGSVVAFAVSKRVCLALGDVIGPDEDRAAALTGFQEFCTRNDWQSAFLSTEPETLSTYEAAGFASFCIGHEAIIDLADFTLAGGQHKDIRGRIAKLTKQGYRTELHQPLLSSALLEDLREISDEWLTMVESHEKSFSVGAFENDYIRNSPLMVVYRPDGTVCAFANLYPEFQRNEATIDLMRRRQNIENGTMEFLFVALFEWSKAQGFDTFNLGLSPLAGIGEETGDPAIERALRYVYENNDQFYNFKGLHGFKSKFHPSWSPRYLIYPGPAALPSVVFAVIRLNAGDDFLWDYFTDRIGTKSHTIFAKVSELVANRKLARNS